MLPAASNKSLMLPIADGAIAFIDTINIGAATPFFRLFQEHHVPSKDLQRLIRKPS